MCRAKHICSTASQRRTGRVYTTIAVVHHIWHEVTNNNRNELVSTNEPQLRTETSLKFRSFRRTFESNSNPPLTTGPQDAFCLAYCDFIVCVSSTDTLNTEHERPPQGLQYTGSYEERESWDKKSQDNKWDEKKTKKCNAPAPCTHR